MTAHGQDVRNVGSIPGAGTATRYVVRRAAAIVAVSDWLRVELERAVPGAAGRVEVADCGVRSRAVRAARRDRRREEVGSAPDGTSFLCLGALSERKNVLRASPGHSSAGEGTLTFVGDGPLREALADVRLVGRVAHESVPAWLAACDVLCQPSLVEPFGLATLEAMASARSVVATRVGGPPEFVTPEAGVPVDPLDEDALVDALEPRRLPRPNPAARARRRRTTSGPRRRRWSRSSSEPLEVFEPDLDERLDQVLEPGLSRDGERLLVSRAPSPGRRPA